MDGKGGTLAESIVLRAQRQSWGSTWKRRRWLHLECLLNATRSGNERRAKAPVVSKEIREAGPAGDMVNDGNNPREAAVLRDERI